MSVEKHIVTGSIGFLDNGIYLVEKSGAKNRIADPIKVTAFGTSEPGTMRELAYTAVRFVDREDKWKSEIVPSSILVSQPGEFAALLAGRGYQWPPTRPLRHKIIGELSIVKPTRRIGVTPVPGCHGDSYDSPAKATLRKGQTENIFNSAITQPYVWENFDVLAL